MMMKIAGRVRGFFAGNYPENREDEQLHINPRGDQIVSLGLPALAELVRLGDSWQVKNVTAAAALTAVPTTTAGLTLWNGEPATGKVYVIDSIAVAEIVVDATQQNQLAIWCMNNKTPVTAPTDAASPIASLSGKTYGGKARTVVGGTVVNDAWFPVGNSVPGAATVAGGSWRTTDVPLNGMHIVPPGGAFNLAASKIAATASQLHFTIRWHEVQILYKS